MNNLNQPQKSNPNNVLSIWQWNCRGLRKKNGLLKQYIQQTTKAPDIILIQESNGLMTIPGYNLFSQPSIQSVKGNNPGNTAPQGKVATYIHKSLDAIQMNTTNLNTQEQEYVATKIKITDSELVILNAYWLPNKAHKKWNDLDRFIRENNRHPLLIAGDFNSPHACWGYAYTSPNGRKLESVMSNRQLTLMNDTTSATRQGNSIEKDTIPDLAWFKGKLNCEWENLLENLGSDHYILNITIQIRRIEKMLKVRK